MFDTGASESMLTRAAARRIGVTPDTPGGRGDRAGVRPGPARRGGVAGHLRLDRDRRRGDQTAADRHRRRRPEAGRHADRRRFLPDAPPLGQQRDPDDVRHL
ncbi:hypothetical protein [Sphingomonas citri]|uniref:hypothetical protein n=1 Tax=Sphingomonas citri TaxID=2862499 RepID=UPI0027E3E764|nr:hypothetical protein [Sphingomonas citri]